MEKYFKLSAAVAIVAASFAVGWHFGEVNAWKKTPCSYSPRLGCISTGVAQ